MTGTVSKHAVRRTTTLVLSTAALLATTALLSGPASAEVPVGWGPTYDVDPLFVLGVLVGVPVLLFVLIVAAVYLPGIARGERVAPGATGPEDQWLGGRREAGEIAAPPAGATTPALGSSESVPTDGGASARW
ncbi:hypothetical protein [Nocardioides plantarum]|uniref:Secreted protein n=1 Tax=Nocardioides plantarum TaxID=29299 RepID=A0ABV5KBU8_9ACTN|nr:hypothetical protein [Nocardioides plantarum]